MLDIVLFRKDKGGNPDIVRESQRRRCQDEGVVDRVIALDEEWRKQQGRADNLRKMVGLCSKAVGEKKKKKEADGDDIPIPKEITDGLEALDKDGLEKLNVTQLKTLSKLVDQEVQKIEASAEEIEKQRNALLNTIGNIVHPDCRATKDEDLNDVVRTWGECKPAAGLLNHVDLMSQMGMDTGETATKVAGGRAFFLQGQLVQLQLGLISYAMNCLVSRGYIATYPPFFMTKDCMGAVAQLADFDDQLYKVTGEGEDKYLIATSEQPICGFHKDKWFTEKDLPIKYGGWSTCFRKEAGSHGKDTLGIFRVHQFEKIEQFCVTTNKGNESWEMMEEMIKNAEDFYKELGLPYRVVRIVAGALNDAAAMKYDLEGFFPASQTYRELVSCSNCTDYQSRAINARMGAVTSKTAGQTQTKEYVHMLNSTLCAVTRVMCCICENYQTSEGVVVPEKLRPYMGNLEIMKFLPPKDK